MRSAPIRFLNAALWPFTIWVSLTHVEEHPADDYVERTSPIIGSALAFWICAISATILWFAVNNGRLLTMDADGVEYGLRVFDRGLQAVMVVLAYFLPVIYVVGFWLFSTRDDSYPR